MLSSLWQPSPLNGSVSALVVDADRLLIGQNSRLTITTITPNDLSTLKTIDLQKGAIRAIASSKTGTLILTEQGLTALDSAYNVMDFAAGGGQHMAIKGNRVYVAALQAGVRVYVFEGGKLKLLGHIETKTAAENVAAEGANWLWVAEGEQGIRLYDLTDPARASVLFWSANLQPARLVRVNGTRLYLGYANRVAVLDTINIKAPRLLGEFALGSDTAFVSDLSLTRSDLLVGLIDQGGADVLRLDISNPKAIREIGRSGSTGSGDHLAVHSDDLFIGSERGGLRRFGLTGSALTPIIAWNAVPDAAPCTDLTPLDPQPANLSEIQSGAAVTLHWNTACPAERYEVRFNGQRLATVDKPEYILKSTTASVAWQIVAMSGSQSAEGARWSFDIEGGGLLAEPQTPRAETILYKPARPVIILQSPAAVLIATCAALLIGLFVIVVGAAMIGAWFEKRRKVY